MPALVFIFMLRSATVRLVPTPDAPQPEYPHGFIGTPSAIFRVGLFDYPLLISRATFAESS